MTLSPDAMKKAEEIGKKCNLSPKSWHIEQIAAALDEFARERVEEAEKEWRDMVAGFHDLQEAKLEERKQWEVKIKSVSEQVTSGIFQAVENEREQCAKIAEKWFRDGCGGVIAKRIRNGEI